MTSGYDFMALYGQADHTVGQLIDAGNYDAVVESAEWGPTSDGSKGQWLVKFRLTSGKPGMVLTHNMTVSPLKNDGAPNDKGLGMLFNQLAALGVPRPVEQPQLWQSPGVEHQVAAMMTGRPALLYVTVDDGNDQYPARNRVKSVKPPRPGAPASYQPQPQQPQGAVPQDYQGGWGSPPQGQLAQQQPQYGPSGFAPPVQQGGPAYYSPQAAQQGGQYQPQQGQQAYPPMQPGQPGTGQFTPQGQAQQPWQQMQAPAQQGQPAQGYQQGPGAAQGGQPASSPSYGQPPAPAPGQPAPWNAPQPQQPQQGYQAPPNGQAGWGQPQQPQQGPDQQQGPGGGPAMPSWMQ